LAMETARPERQLFVVGTVCSVKAAGESTAPGPRADTVELGSLLKPEFGVTVWSPPTPSQSSSTHALARKERALISQRTKAALKAAKARGVQLGNAAQSAS
jgi:hypothetical protein